MTAPHRLKSLVGFELHPHSVTEARAMLGESRAGSGRVIHLCNTYTAALATEDPELLRALRQPSAVNLVDGWPVAWVARRVSDGDVPVSPGPELMREALSCAGPGGPRHAIFGSTPEVVTDLRDRLRDWSPDLQIAFAGAPPFGSVEDILASSAFEALQAAQPDIIWVGLGTPLQDVFAARAVEILAATYVCVGAAFPFLAGHVERAPEVWQRLRVEWLHRLLSEPRRLLPRYLRAAGWLRKVRRRGRAPVFITNFPNHYDYPLLQRMAAESWDLVCYSDGSEWYAERRLARGDLPIVQMRGRWIGDTYVTPGLAPHLLRTSPSVVVKSISGVVAVAISYAYSRSLRRPFVLYTGVWRHPETRKWRLLGPFLRRLYRSCDAIVTYGAHVSAFVIEQGADQSKVFTGAKCIENAEFAGRQRPPLSEHAVRIALVGRLVHEKGVGVLVEALRLVDADVHVTFAGDGPLRPEVERLAAEGSLRIDILGRIGRSEVADLLRTSDVLVLPSISTDQWTEPWGLVTNEGLAAGCFVIASDAVGAAAGGLVRNGETGLVVPSGDAAALAGAILWAVHNRREAQAIAVRGQADVQEFNYDRMFDAFARAVRSVY